MNKYRIHCKQVVEEPSDTDDRQELNLGKDQELTWDTTANNESDALDMFHRSQPIGCLEDYEVTVEVVGPSVLHKHYDGGTM